MKKVVYGVMAVALSLGLAAAPSFAATPRAKTTSHVTQVQQQTTTKKAPAKKTAAKKAPAKKTAKKAPAKKKTSA
jgi:hypothetical protein